MGIFKFNIDLKDYDSDDDRVIDDKVLYKTGDIFSLQDERYSSQFLKKKM